MDSSFQLTIVYDISYFVKFTALSIKTICRTLPLLVSQIAISCLVREVIIKFSI